MIGGGGVSKMSAAAAHSSSIDESVESNDKNNFEISLRVLEIP